MARVSHLCREEPVVVLAVPERPVGRRLAQVLVGIFAKIDFQFLADWRVALPQDGHQIEEPSKGKRRRDDAEQLEHPVELERERGGGEQAGQEEHASEDRLKIAAAQRRNRVEHADEMRFHVTPRGNRVSILRGAVAKAEPAPELFSLVIVGLFAARLSGPVIVNLLNRLMRDASEDRTVLGHRLSVRQLRGNPA